MKHLPLWRNRRSSEVPFYCSPVHLFFIEWALMLVTLFLRISYSSFPDVSVGALLFCIASVSFVGGFWTLRFAYRAIRSAPPTSDYYVVRLGRLRVFHAVGVAITLAIMYMNLKLFGLPPVFGFLGADTLDYQTYGSLRQPLFASILAIFVSAPLEPSPWRRWALYVFSPVCFLIYASRGFLLIMLFQALAVFSSSNATEQNEDLPHLRPYVGICAADLELHRQ